MTIDKTVNTPVELKQEVNKEIHFDKTFFSQDKNTAKLEFNIVEDGMPVVLTGTSMTATIAIKTYDGSLFTDAAVIDVENAGLIYYILTDEQLKREGKAQGELYINDGTKRIAAIRFSFRIKLSLVDEVGIKVPLVIETIDSAVERLINANPTQFKGQSAYESAVANGFTGTEQEWIASLKAKIEGNSIGLVHTRFKKTSSNIAEVADLVKDTYLDGTKGTEVSSTSYKSSDFVPVTPGDLLLLAYIRSYAFYDANKTYITGAANVYYLQPYVSPHVEVPANAAVIKYSVNNANLEQFALIKNDYMYSDKRKYVIDKRYIEDIQISDIKGLVPSKNLFDKTKVEANRLIKGDLTTASGSGYNLSILIPVEVGQSYTFTNVHSVVYYNDKYVAQLYKGLPTTEISNYPYIRVNVTTANLDTAQIEKGTVATPYASFTEKKIPAELLPSNIGGGTAYNQSLNKADSVIFNKVTAKVIEADSIISPAILPKGTLASPPSGLVSGDMWADTTDSTKHPILRVMM